MRTYLKTTLSIFILLGVLSCSKITEKIEKKVDEKVDKEIEKTTQEMEKQLKQVDSVKQEMERQKETGLKEIIGEEKILKDEKGQWASSADASSSYAGERGGKDASWSPDQMIGVPDVPDYGDDGRAWASLEQDKSTEWVKLTFPEAVNATEVRIRQTYNPGAVIKIELIDTQGKSHTVWEGVDKTKYEQDKIKYFIAAFDKTDYKTKAVKITLGSGAVAGWNEIDAVQLVGE